MKNNPYKFSPLTVSGADDSAAGSVRIRCNYSGEVLPWNQAARAGWVADLNGTPYKAYYNAAARASLENATIFSR